ncbi:flagellar protein FlaG [Sporomusa sp.]|uniref:flagellar protein FlaG n=1 Tax=Sporomusa sp. TaxID=2078658 RepID=UPI002CF9781A|nr:flagellar protein FlaG [Sporomusa sp.]HWR45784.1 flagellar protein FlaG [Sporomusa sp.]
MEINTGKVMAYPSVRTAGSSPAEQASTEVGFKSADNTNLRDEKINKEDLSKMTGELNKFMQLINADLKFVLHEKTQRLIVQVVDTKEQKVLKEFPPHELLDTIAGIQEYVGILLDKKV